MVLKLLCELSNFMVGRFGWQLQVQVEKLCEEPKYLQGYSGGISMMQSDAFQAWPFWLLKDVEDN